jgi:hypothetical protein
MRWARCSATALVRNGCRNLVLTAGSGEGEEKCGTGIADVRRGWFQSCIPSQKKDDDEGGGSFWVVGILPTVVPWGEVSLRLRLHWSGRTNLSTPRRLVF